ncbi:hypothetical protein [Nocardia sp. NPDC052566]|uniref:hypothetical protein n=1 Tax=Nocardia sp. NPDC052566 TaxID=3364330 RepID=UPI0037C5F932
MVTDGASTTVGHGRLLPLVGNRRPYQYDVRLPDSQRIYADTPEDVIAVIVGGDYAQLVAAAADLEESSDQDAIDAVRIERVRLRHRHADQVRLRLQQEINEHARRDHSWDTLDPAERQQLESAADPDGTYPVGIPTEQPMINDSGSVDTVWRGMWFTKIQLVVNTGDYMPFSDALIPESHYAEPDSDGRLVVVAGDPNLVLLDISDEVAYLNSLQTCGYAEVTIREVEQPDPHFRRISVPS